MHIYIVRHGQSEANLHKTVSGSSETPLTELGRNQVRLAAHEAKRLDIDYIVCSPLKRAHESAIIIAEVLGVPRSDIHIVESLRERHMGKLEGQSYANNQLQSGDFKETETYPGMEPIDVFHARIQHALRELLADKSHKNVLVVSHNTVGRMLQIVAANKPAMAMYDVPRLPNGHIQQLL